MGSPYPKPAYGGATGHKVSQGCWAGDRQGRWSRGGEGTFLKQMGVGSKQGDCRGSKERHWTLDGRVLPRGLGS